MRDASGGCPVRKLTPPGETATGPDVERVHGPDGTRIVVRSFALAREVLRDEDGYRQAGFGAETVRTQSTMRPPILYLDGPDHRAQRRASAPFFTPKAVEGYRPMMEELAERLVAGLRPDRGTDLADLAMRMAVEVVGRVVGLTHSSTSGMTRRLNTFFDGDPLAARFTVRGLPRLVRTHTATLQFYWLDVKPAIRAHRKEPKDDLISATLEQGFTDLEILTEAVTYGAAGMVTTRELISIGAWHLLERPELLDRFRQGDSEARSRCCKRRSGSSRSSAGCCVGRAARSGWWAAPAGSTWPRATSWTRRARGERRRRGRRWRAAADCVRDGVAAWGARRR